MRYCRYSTSVTRGASDIQPRHLYLDRVHLDAVEKSNGTMKDLKLRKAVSDTANFRLHRD
jgi:hypothetical protein